MPRRTRPLSLWRGSVLFPGVVGLETFFHDSDCGGAFVDHDEAALVFGCGFGGGSATGEEVEDGVSGVGVDTDDALENS